VISLICTAGICSYFSPVDAASSLARVVELAGCDRTVAALRELAGSAMNPSRITVEFMRFGARESQVSIEHRLRFAASARRLRRRVVRTAA
jgi:hypothetical protein